MTIMHCQCCHKVADCRVESPQPARRTLYFEHPYMNVYVRERTCSKCGASFSTYELGAPSFKAMRKCVEMSMALGGLVDETWAQTKDEFVEYNEALAESRSEEDIKFEEDLEKQPSYLGDNVISLFRNRDHNKGD